MRVLLPLCVLVALLLAGCGGGDRTPDQAQPAPPTATTPVPETGPDAAPDRAPAPPAPGAELPAGVPTAPDGPAPAGSIAVIERWLGAVRRADFRAAAEAFALPAVVQNGGPVSRLRSRAELVVWNAALPCGAKVAEAGGARGYTVLTFTLTDREGGSCGSGVGAPAYGAIRVRDGRITEWYRLPDPVAPPRDPDAPFV